MFAFKPLAAIAAATACISAQAQVPPPPADARSAADSPAAERPVNFKSTLRSYRGFADEPVGPWREANETVQRIGGWQAYGRESREALRAPAPPPQRPASPPSPSADGHDAHHGAPK